MHTDYKSRGGQLPVRWTAIEALEDRKFNEKTDVWSCGVMLYEIWTNGLTPYYGWSNQKVWVEVAAGYRLPQPADCSTAVHNVMLRCWEKDQGDRPTFLELKAFFRELAGVTNDDGDGEVMDDSYLQVDAEDNMSTEADSMQMASLQKSKRNSTASSVALDPIMETPINVCACVRMCVLVGMRVCIHVCVCVCVCV